MVSGLILAVGLLAAGCATQPSAVAPKRVTTENSPLAEAVAPRDALKLAESFAAAHPGSEIMVGSGDSMRPFYTSRTVLVVQPMNMADLKSGMTVVFVGARGRPVAHALVENTPRGWIAMGTGNDAPDERPVQFRNYIGTVIKAFTPTAGVALTAREAQGNPIGQRVVAAEPALRSDYGL